MTDQLQDLLQRVYEEGVSKAKAEADKILRAAQQTADDTVSNAKIQADKIISDAQNNASELAKNSETDLKMAAQHTINSVKQRLIDVVQQKVLDEAIKVNFADPAFLKQIILSALEAWKTGGGEGNIMISETMRGKLDEGFMGSLKDALGSGLKVDFSPALKNGFILSPVDGGYKLSFTDEDFANLFKSYLRPRTAQLLFSE